MRSRQQEKPADLVRPQILKVCDYASTLDSNLLEVNAQSLSRMGIELPGFDVRKALFLDTETTGLSRGAGTVAFLVGVGWVSGNRFLVRQLLMPDYSVEPLLLSTLAEIMRQFEYVVSFNGKAFDMPLLEVRFTMSRMAELYKPMQQIDLLHPARRLYKLRLNSCKLSRLENHILDINRENDLPGSEVPQRYFDYLKTGDERLLDDILEHNRQDIVSLGTLLGVLSRAYLRPTDLQSAMDLYSVGRALERGGERQAAVECYTLAARSMPATSLQSLRDKAVQPDALWALSMIHKRAGDYEQAVQQWQQLINSEQLGLKPYLEMLKHLEHREKNFEQALKLCQAARRWARSPAEISELEKRENRLRLKAERKRVTFTQINSRG